MLQGIAAYSFAEILRLCCHFDAAGPYLQWEACPRLRPAIEKTLAMRLRDKVH